MRMLSNFCVLSEFTEDLSRHSQKQLGNFSSQPHNQTFNINQVSLNNYTKPNSILSPNYSSYSNPSPVSKPLSLSQLHQQQSHPNLTQNQGQFFLHDQQPAHRRTWSQQHAERTSWNQQSERNERNVPQPFTLHDSRLQNGGSHPTPSPRSVNTSPLHVTMRPSPPPKPVVPPRQTPPVSVAYPAPLPTPSVDDMEPQSICFIGDNPSEDPKDVSLGMGHLNITSGSRTYRIPSPTRPLLTKNPFVQPSYNRYSEDMHVETQPPEKGFYISFDDEAPPKRPKPPLRGKRSPKKVMPPVKVVRTFIYF